MRATVDTHIRVPMRDLGRREREALLDSQSLKFDHPDGGDAAPELEGWNVVDGQIVLWRVEDSDLVLPRGFASRFLGGMNAMGKHVDITDNRVLQPRRVLTWMDPIDLRKHQGPAVDAMIGVEQGQYQAPPGSGKTVTVLEAWRRSGQVGHILVDRSHIMHQWRERCEQFLGFTPGMVGDGEFDVRELTICMVQTLWSRRQELDAEGFFSPVGFATLDESHHASAFTYHSIMERYAAYWRGGVSATPDKDNAYFPIILALLGEIYHVTPLEQLFLDGTLVRPSVVIVPTQYRYKLRRGPRGWPTMMSDLAQDEERADLVASMCDRGGTHLVLSGRLAHLHLMRDLCEERGWPADRLHILTGEQWAPERMAIAEAADAGDCVMFSTVADEAFDVPRIDRVHVAYPVRSEGGLRQKIGRGMRKHAKKVNSIVFDYADKQQSTLHDQHLARIRGVYRPDNLPITTFTGH